MDIVHCAEGRDLEFGVPLAVEEDRQTNDRFGQVASAATSKEESMKKARVLSFVSIAIALAIGLGARTAAALPCCSACDFNPRACLHGCSGSCVADDEPIAPDQVIYDDVAKVCYAVTAP